jgi:hypothetical protein
MQIIQKPKKGKKKKEINGICKEKTKSVQPVKKNSVRIFVEKIYKMGCLGGSGVRVLYIYIYIYMTHGF